VRSKTGAILIFFVTMATKSTRLSTFFPY